MSEIHWGLETAKLVVPVVIPVTVAWITYTLAVRKLQKDNREALERQKYEAILLAHRRAWALIAYMTETENARSVVTWKKQKEVRTNYFNPVNARKFMDSLREVFYDEGHGIFLSREVTDLLHEYRIILYGLLLRHDGKDDIVVIEKPELAKELFAKSVKLIAAVRDSMEVTERRLDLKKD
jgi:hypothetical protein